VSDLYEVDLLIENGYLVTVDRDRRLIDGGTVAIKNHRIIDIGPDAELAGRYTAPKRIDASRKAVMPGLIDTHGHGGHTLMKTVGHNLNGFGWRTMIDHVYFRATDEAFWYADGQLSALERLKFGTTLGMSILGSAPRTDRPEPAERFAEGVAEVGIRGAVGVGPARPPWPKVYSWWENGKKTDYTATMEDNFRVTGELVKKKHGFANGLISIWMSASRFSAPSPYDPMFNSSQLTVAREQARLMDKTAREYQIGIHTHAYGGAVEYAHREFKILGPHVCLAHCQGLSEEEVKIFADTGATVSFCPTARRIYSYPAICPVPQLIDAGATVAIATDGSSPDRSFDLFKDMRAAMMLLRYAQTDPWLLPPGKVIEMVTIDAARALNMADTLGSLEVGKQADVITIDLTAPHMRPRFMTPFRLVYEAGGHDVQDVVVNGRLLMEDRKVLSVDEEKICTFAQEQAELAIRRSGVAPLMELPDRFWSHSRG